MKDRMNFNDLLKWQQQMLDTHGWFIHHVFDADQTPNNINYHTHGLRENLDHPDLQLCLPIRQEDAHALFELAVAAIRNGDRFEAGKDFADILPNGYRLQFMHVQESGRRVLRMLVPDASGGYSEEPYRQQLELPYDGVPLLPLYYETADISDAADVRMFLQGLICEHRLNFHPDAGFENYIDTATGKPVFRPKDAEHLDRLMEHCFRVCGKKADIYGMALDITRRTRKAAQAIRRNAGPRH